MRASVIYMNWSYLEACRFTSTFCQGLFRNHVLYLLTIYGY